MRHLLWILLLVGLVISGSSAAMAQDPTPPPADPLYSVMFPTFIGTRYITNYTDTEWRGGELRGRVVYGDANGTRVQPLWSPDGQIIYSTVYAPNRQDLAVTIYAYYLSSKAFVPLMDLQDINDPALLPEIAGLESISPDGRYAWVRFVNAQQTRLVDLENKTLVGEVSACPARVLLWLGDEVLLSCTGELFSSPDLFTLELSTGKRERTLLPPAPNASNPFAAFPKTVQVLDDGRLLVGPLDGDTESAVGVISLDDYTGTYLGTGSYLQVKSDQSSATFYQAGRLQRINLADLTLTDLGVASPTNSLTWYGDYLRFWRVQEDFETFSLVRVEVYEWTRTEQVMYSGPKPFRYVVGPRGDVIVLEWSGYVEVYKDGALLWSSREEYPDGLVSLPPPAYLPVLWSGNGKWLHLTHVPSAGRQAETLSVNIGLGQSLLAVEERATFLGESPDQDWWLMGVNYDPNSDRRDRLIAYNPVSNQLWGILPNGIPLYSDIIAPEWAYFSWAMFQ